MENLNMLISVLESQLKCYQDLLGISKTKTDVIVGGKVHELENITKVEQTIIMKMGDLEDDLDKLIRLLVRELGITEKDVTISVFLRYVQGTHKEKLETLKEDIFKTVGELDHVNKLNAQLIRNSLEYINFSINLYSNTNSDSNGSYQQNGEIRGSKSSFFDMKL